MLYGCLSSHTVIKKHDFSFTVVFLTRLLAAVERDCLEDELQGVFKGKTQFQVDIDTCILRKHIYLTQIHHEANFGEEKYPNCARNRCIVVKSDRASG